MSTVLSIAFIILMAILIRSGVSFVSKHIKYPRMRWVLSIYLGVLILSVGVFYFLPADHFSEDSVLDKLTGDMIGYPAYPDYYDLAKRDVLNETNDVFLQGEWSFDISGDKLEILTHDGNYYHALVIAERTQELEGKIEVKSYKTPHMVGTVDITDKIIPPMIDLKSQQIIISFERVKMEFAAFKKDFTVTQFQETVYRDHTRGFSHMSGPMLLYLRIPPTMELSGFVDNVLYIN
ncbi:hypothetical protein BHU72_05555 [Desulfuribacillus stibiiarsenatis]|uniref:Uncharacterized protein n=1 Tax=Desulfuribacillus stibiiarsenatis TaxID=1390249 RepID=A0A1E5L4L7_9FIRM|nr:hypothetical protein [Desulfuribacillus stibiiarsenatis]OEH85077.1 hypothetical protein BHU72_05555 [Desulfuribacillus stibiiarsenatis]